MNIDPPAIDPPGLGDSAKPAPKEKLRPGSVGSTNRELETRCRRISTRDTEPGATSPDVPVNGVPVGMALSRAAVG